MTHSEWGPYDYLQITDERDFTPPSEPDTSVEAPPNVRHGDGISDWPSPHLAPPTWGEMKFVVVLVLAIAIFAAGYFLGSLP